MIRIRDLYSKHELHGLMCIRTGQAQPSFYAFVRDEYAFRAVLARRVEPKLKRGKRAA